MKKILISLSVIVILLGAAGGLMYLFGQTPPQISAGKPDTELVHTPEAIPTPAPEPTPTPTPELTPTPSPEPMPTPTPTPTPTTTPASEEKKEDTKKEDAVQTDKPQNTQEYNGWPAIPSSQLPQPDGPANTYEYNGSTIVITGGTPQTAGNFLGIQPDEPTAVIPGYNTESVVTANVSSLGKQIFDLTNKERTEQGLKELSYAYDLQGAADTRAKEASTLFSHTRPDGTSCHDIVTKDYYVTGENLIMADKPIATAENLVAEWMNSEGHRHNILLGEYTELAVGVYEKDGVVYACQIFIG